MKYVYPAIFTPLEDGYDVHIPDLPGCRTCGDTLIEAIEMAEDALCLMLYHAEEDGLKIPPPSKAQNIKHVKGEFVQYISCDTDFYRRYFATKAIKKTLTIPSYLNAMAERAGVNFSALLQEALKKRLAIQ